MRLGVTPASMASCSCVMLAVRRSCFSRSARGMLSVAIMFVRAPLGVGVTSHTFAENLLLTFYYQHTARRVEVASPGGGRLGLALSRLGRPGQGAPLTEAAGTSGPSLPAGAPVAVAVPGLAGGGGPLGQILPQAPPAWATTGSRAAGCGAGPQEA